ncbi:MAG: hypothetical protein MI784_08425 [Cytophagales bacterium]|nr:hypothetical protein [Cytophagales bacterium]
MASEAGKGPVEVVFFDREGKAERARFRKPNGKWTEASYFYLNNVLAEIRCGLTEVFWESEDGFRVGRWYEKGVKVKEQRISADSLRSVSVFFRKGEEYLRFFECYERFPVVRQRDYVLQGQDSQYVYKSLPVWEKAMDRAWTRRFENVFDRSGNLTEVKVIDGKLVAERRLLQYDSRGLLKKVYSKIPGQGKENERCLTYTYEFK